MSEETTNVRHGPIYFYTSRRQDLRGARPNSSFINEERDRNPSGQS